MFDIQKLCNSANINICKPVASAAPCLVALYGDLYSGVDFIFFYFYGSG